MRNARTFAHDLKGNKPRMAWSADNLYSLIARSTLPNFVRETTFRATALTMYQQRWRSKRLLRSYHGDWLPEKRFKRWFLPTALPALLRDAVPSSKSTAAGARDRLALSRSASSSASGESLLPGFGQDEPSADQQMPVASLFVREIERRLDTAVFRACFARSVYEARSLVVHGHVKLNGFRMRNPNTLLNPGDLISVDPASIPMLSPKLRTGLFRNGGSAAFGDDAATEPIKRTSRPVNAKNAKAKERTKEREQNKEVKEASSARDEGKDVGEGEAAAAKNLAEEPIPQQTEKKVQLSPRRPPSLPAGVEPFVLPAYAATQMFIPGNIEVSFKTCSFIYVRHPTILKKKATLNDRGAFSGPIRKDAAFNSDLPSPYPAGGEMFSLAWEYYVKNSPRVRSDLRRQRETARVGKDGFERERAKTKWGFRRAIRRGTLGIYSPGGRIAPYDVGVSPKTPGSKPLMGKTPHPSRTARP
ncbi:alpha-L RNA-binding motif-containing protein [Ceraceosorus guamensis]|uniref:Alpha-L RNA-binding motif-containing protein n=1 Tax=Ceraceosorus guamensis TaxID=1522189 RepID=A0A316W479_9BASI|nr:alpha-L RNA-binding motif-containing protein [Ceraceosorus guamensis]PWN43431.1 alpha-L RNA-binding motif-containing protein [Ceraceosorus guamensis]